MNYANYIKILLKGIVVSVAMFLLSVSGASAQSLLDVEFIPNPLFEKLNFLPGDRVTGTVTVTNKSSTTQDVLVETINASDDGNLGDKLRLVITEGGTERYNNMLGEFLTASEVYLSELSGNSSTTYLFSVTFEDDAGNDLQEKGLGFDLCVGFEGGTMHCGDTIVGDEDGETEDGGTIIPGSPAGGGGGLLSLVISNESATVGVASGVIPPNGMATVKWDTNFLSTSQVIYRLATDDYSLNVNTLPYFGYPMGTDEDKVKVASHSVLLEGLINGETYKYRVVSRASPATISYEHTFFVEMEVGELLDDEDPNSPVVDGQDPKLLAHGNSVVGTSLGQDSGETGVGGETSGTGGDDGIDLYGADTNLDQTENDSEKEVEPSGNLASVLSAFLENNLSVGKIISILLLLLLLFLLWRALSKRSRDTREGTRDV